MCLNEVTVFFDNNDDIMMESILIQYMAMILPDRRDRPHNDKSGG